MFLFAPAIVIMMASIFLQGGNFTSNTQQNVTICNVNGCVPPGTSTVITCNNFLTPCQILPGCSSPPAPAWCFPWPFNLIPSNAGTWLNAGATVVLTSTQVNAAVTANSALFAFGSIGPSGWTNIILIAAGIVTLASIAVFSTGMGPEGVHILAVSGVALGIWLFLSAMDGFITGNPNSLFSQLNLIKLAGAAGFGTMLYVICSMFWVFGWLGAFTWG